MKLESCMQKSTQCLSHSLEYYIKKFQNKSYMHYFWFSNRSITNEDCVYSLQRFNLKLQLHLASPITPEFFIALTAIL